MTHLFSFPCPHCQKPIGLGTSFPIPGGLVVCTGCLGFSVFDTELTYGGFGIGAPFAGRHDRTVLRRVQEHEMLRTAFTALSPRQRTVRVTVEDCLNETRNLRIWCVLGHRKPRIQVTA